VACDTEGVSSEDVVGDGIQRVDLQRERARVDSDVVHSAPDAPVSEWGVRVRAEEETCGGRDGVGCGVVVGEVVAAVVVVNVMIVVVMQGDDVRDGR
jgi:hypothetical protein